MFLNSKDLGLRFETGIGYNNYLLFRNNRKNQEDDMFAKNLYALND
jgi:hypothetical protein